MQINFDRGTLLFRETPPSFETQDFVDLAWDPRVGAFRAPSFRYSEIRARLKEREIPFEDSVQPEMPSSSMGDWKEIPLRPYQKAALDAWELAQNRGIIVLPTGSGKTWLALAAMAKMRVNTLCLVPTRVLLEQWQNVISQHYTGEIGIYGDGSREVASLTIATFESAYRYMPQFGNRFNLLIIDEVHHFGSGFRDEALEMSMARARLGLTATPVPPGPARIKMRELVGPIAYELHIDDLRGRFLADFDLIPIQVELYPMERKAYELEMNLFREVHQHFRKSYPEASWRDFARIVSRTEDGRRALTALQNARRQIGFTSEKARVLESILARHSLNRVLVFTSDVETAYKISRKHLVMPLTADISRTEREEALQAFREGRLRTLVSCRVLNEGLDVPDADVAIIVGGALGEREQVQRVGRLLRPKEGKRAIVYELVCRNTIEVRQSKRRNISFAARNVA